MTAVKRWIMNPEPGFHTRDYTPGPWSMGFTIMTKQTAMWTPNQVIDNDKMENRRLYANFRLSDEGRSRVLLAEFSRPEDAAAASFTPLLIQCLKLVSLACEQNNGRLPDKDLKMVRDVLKEFE